MRLVLWLHIQLPEWWFLDQKVEFDFDSRRDVTGPKIVTYRLDQCSGCTTKFGIVELISEEYFMGILFYIFKN